MTIERLMEIIEALDGAGIVIEDPEMIREELSVLGFCSETDPTCEDEDDEG